MTEKRVPRDGRRQALGSSLIGTSRSHTPHGVLQGKPPNHFAERQRGAVVNASDSNSNDHGFDPSRDGLNGKNDLPRTLTDAASGGR